MIMPTRCPICQGIMMTTWILHPKNEESIEKKCTNRPTHHISFQTSTTNYDLVDSVRWYYSSAVRLDWVMSKDTLHVLTKNSASRFPFFVPDFSDIAKLKQKVKTYLLFS